MSESNLAYMKLINLKRRYASLLDTGPAATVDTEALRLARLRAIEREFKIRAIPAKDWQS